ncbi:hypothetical protein [Vibrio misgurnus]|uniref:hypothetical protein n=1 Tax=Vibrio misgurnus TaxID=2993714 RepID=UPI0023F84391|nr:hypothetical protein [Vibrio sp. VCS]
MNTDANHSRSPMMVSAVTSVNQSSVTHPQLKDLSPDERQDLFKLLNKCSNYNKQQAKKSPKPALFPLNI